MEQNEMQKQIIEKGFQIPPNMFDIPEVEAEPKGEQKVEVDVVQKLHDLAVLETVKHDDAVKEEIAATAKDTIHNKTRKIKDQADAEAKEAHFNNHKGACECFGFTEKDTERWAVTMMTFWHRAMTAIWIVLGFVTYAPISFIASKVGVIIKRTWLAVAVSGLLYVLIALSPIWFTLLKKIGGAE